MFNKYRCLIGLHRWDKGRCTRIRICTDCKKKQIIRNNLSSHKWRDPVYEGTSCNLVIVCSCCNERKIIDKKHIWDTWEKDKGKCIKTRKCSRCGNVEILETHKWESWKYIDDHSCLEVHFCVDCGKKETNERHSWKPWTSYDNNVHIRHCQRNSEHFEKESHKFKTRIEGRTDTARGAGRCIDQSWGLCYDVDTTITEEIIECEKCDFEEARVIDTKVEEVGRLY